jgi:hypothetical protein
MSRSVVALLFVACGGAPALVAEPELEAPVVAPVETPRAARAQRLAVTDRVSCRINADHSVECWGSGAASGAPRVMPDLADAAQIVMSASAVCVRHREGGVTCSNAHGASAIDVEDAVELSTQFDEHCAVRASGHVVCWGGTWSRSGTESWRSMAPYADHEDPVQRVDVTDAIALRAPAASPDSAETSPCWCALRANGRVRCWGECNGVPGTRRDEGGFDVRGITDAVDLELWHDAICAARRGGGMACAGEGFARREDGAFEVIAGTEDVVSLEQLSSLRTRALCGVTGDGRHLCVRALPTEWQTDREGAAAAAYWEEHENEQCGDDELCGPLEPPALPRGWDQLADTSDNPGAEAIEWSAMRDYTEAVATRAHACGIRSDGRVSCWGALAEVGRGRIDASPIPVRVEGLANVEEISTNHAHTCARTRDGSIWCWGNNSHAAILPSEDRSVPLPARVASLSPAAHVVAGTFSTCAIDRRGAVRCIGGIGHAPDHAARPWVMPGARAATSLVVSQSTVCAIAGGRLRCLYADDRDRENPRFVPFDVAVPNPIELSGSHQMCARSADGRVGCWTPPYRDDLAREPIWRLEGATSMSAHAHVVCATTSAGLRCTGTTRDNPIEESVPAPTFDDVEHVAVGLWHACVIRADRSVWCWGGGSRGQTGRGTFEGGVAAPVAGIDDAVQVVAGDEHSCALRADRSVWCWGSDADGQLGNGPIAAVETDEPVEVP